MRVRAGSIYFRGPVPAEAVRKKDRRSGDQVWHISWGPIPAVMDGTAPPWADPRDTPPTDRQLAFAAALGLDVKGHDKWTISAAIGWIAEPNEEAHPNDLAILEITDVTGLPRGRLPRWKAALLRGAVEWVQWTTTWKCMECGRWLGSDDEICDCGTLYHHHYILAFREGRRPERAAPENHVAKTDAPAPDPRRRKARPPASTEEPTPPPADAAVPDAPVATTTIDPHHALSTAASVTERVVLLGTAAVLRAASTKNPWSTASIAAATACCLLAAVAPTWIAALAFTSTLIVAGIALVHGLSGGGGLGHPIVAVAVATFAFLLAALS